MNTPIDLRPLWFLARGGRPIPASSKKPSVDATYWCREGDLEWTRLGPTAPTTPTPDPTPKGAPRP